MKNTNKALVAVSAVLSAPLAMADEATTASPFVADIQGHISQFAFDAGEIIVYGGLAMLGVVAAIAVFKYGRRAI